MKLRCSELGLFVYLSSAFVHFTAALTLHQDTTYARLLESYQEGSPQTCTVSGTDGKCLFVWDCHKTDGTSLGLCRLDTSIYGSCCYHNESMNSIDSQTTMIPDLEIDYGDAHIPPISAEAGGSSDPGGGGGKPEFDMPTTLLPDTAGMIIQVPEMETYPGSPECGASVPAAKKLSSLFRIVGGENSHFAKWPWVVSVRRASLFGYSSTHSCGGVLLNENWVATAAHCVVAMSKSLIRVRLGEYDFQDVREELPFTERKIDDKIIYPTYNYTTYEDDLALLKLSKPVNFTKHISPLCLPQNLNDSLAGLNGTIVGWGRLSENGQYSQQQKFVEVPIVSNAECVSMFKMAGRDEKIPPHFICAGFSQGGKDGCQGDSGGPLQVLGQNGRWFLVGIMSWGIGCGEPNQPGVYTRITAFANWILERTR